jgi:hypothetical protein
MRNTEKSPISIVFVSKDGDPVGCVRRERDSGSWLFAANRSMIQGASQHRVGVESKEHGIEEGLRQLKGLGFNGSFEQMTWSQYEKFAEEKAAADDAAAAAAPKASSGNARRKGGRKAA